MMLIVALLEEWRGEERERIYPLKIDEWDELNPAPYESLGQGKARPDFFTRARWSGTKIVPPKMPHGMSECSGRPLVYNLWTWFDEIERSYWPKFWEFEPALNPAPNIKWLVDEIESM